MRIMINKITKIIFAICIVCGFAGCADFFDQESEHVIFSDQDHLNNATDTIYSVTGILNKLQALADRTILLGEVRGDLVDVTDVTNNDLREVAQFNIGDENMYNRPSDYYAVINNCNYFIANADTALRNNRNEYIFMKEYAAVKAIRAWTYLQLVLNYGSVPFVTEPILTKEQSEAVYPRYDIQAVCEYFINDLQPLTDKYSRDYPGYRDIRNTDSRFFWFPLYIVLGDLHLWAGSAGGSVSHYRDAALSYYNYINDRNGMNSAYPTSVCLITYTPGNTTWNGITGWGNLVANEGYSDVAELITMIPGDSIRAEGNYSELRNLFNSSEDNQYKVSLKPSAGLIQLSEAQVHCCVSKNGQNVLYAPQGLPNHRSGDLRLWNVFAEGHTYDKNTGDQVETQYIEKYTTRNVHIYRRQMVYLRMAEALNLAGFPRMAFQVLSQGLNNDVIEEEVYPYCSQSDSLFVSQFDFPKSRYGIFTVEHLVNNSSTGNINTMGIHSRGSGWTPMNEYYQLSVDTTRTEEAQKADLQAYVNGLILDEGALEFAFEGTRFYDLMRFALRSDNPGQFMAEKVYGRRGKANADAVRAEIKNDISNPRNWYLQWNGKIGFE